MVVSSAGGIGSGYIGNNCMSTPPPPPLTTGLNTKSLEWCPTIDERNYSPKKRTSTTTTTTEQQQTNLLQQKQQILRRRQSGYGISITTFV